MSLKKETLQNWNKEKVYGYFNESMVVFCYKHITAAGMDDRTDGSAGLHFAEKALV